MGEVTRIYIRKCDRNYMVDNDAKDKYIYFFTVKDRLEYAMYNKETKVLYLNSKLKGRFKNILSELKQDYEIADLSEYIPM